MDIKEPSLKTPIDVLSESKFLYLQTEFRQELPKTLSEITQYWKIIFNNKSNADDLKNITHLLLYLADTAGTYGTDEVSYIARKCYITFKPFIGGDYPLVKSAKITNELNDWLMQLSVVSKEWLSTDAPILQLTKFKSDRKEKMIYSLIGDDVFSSELTIQVENNNCNIQRFNKLTEIKSACENKNPMAIIVDGDTVGVDAVEYLKEHVNACPPVIFISNENDAAYRLKVTRAGVDRYFCRTAKIDKIIHTLIGLNSELDNIPYRVLIIDNDIPLLECYSTVLLDSDMVVLSESKPLEGYAAIEKFLPDVIVLDMYMPECSGEELVNMIRLDDRWALIPIIFLSGEQDIQNQLHAMKFGADDFLVKPVNTNKLVATINALAKRARKNVKLHKELKNSLRENKYQLIALDQHAIVSAADVNGTIVHVNDKLCKVSGYSREELLDKNHSILKSGHHDNAFYKELWGTISSGKIWHGIICNKSKNGGEYWVDSTIVPFLDEKGKPYKYVSVRTDVTKLRESEGRLRRSQEFANIGTWDWNIISGELYWSDRIWPLFGYDKNNIDINYENFIEAVHPEDRELVINAITDCSENGNTYDIEHRVVWPDGSTHWVHESGNMIRNSYDEPVHMLGVVRDITAFKITEQEMIDAREEAEKANQAKSQFLSNMSHELRTPMNAILGFSQLLQRSKIQPLTELQSTNVEEIIVAGKHLMSLINEVLDLSKIEAGHIDLSLSSVNVSEIIKESLQLVIPLAQKRGIEVVIVSKGKTIGLTQLEKKNYFAYIDETRTKQIILNLLSNAVKYNSENGKITLTYDGVTDGLFRVSIADTGNGLNVKQQEQLFTAFNRLGLENTTVEGSGIGLFITKKLVDLMDGKIGVNSKVGEGSTFWFELPIKLESGVEKIKNEIKNINIEEHNMEQKNEKRSILYIEDNPANLRLVEQILSTLPQIQMWSAPEPLLGLELATENIPSLILLDINLPGMDGYQVLEKLRNLDSTKDIPVIAISANAMPKDIEKGKRAGFDGYITKPVNVKELLEEVESKLPKV